MYQRILVASDFTAASDAAAREAVALAATLESRLTAVHVVEPYARHVISHANAKPTETLGPVEYRELTERQGRAGLRKVADSAGLAHVACDMLVVASDDPCEGILEAARSGDCDLIVVGTPARQGLERLFLGSVASELLIRSKVPVLVCR